MTRALPSAPANGRSGGAPVVVDGEPSVRRRGPFAGWTLRRKLVASMLVLFVAVSLLSGIATLFSLQKSLQSDLDERVMNQSARFRPDDGDGRGPRGNPPGLGGDFLLLVVSDGVAQRELGRRLLARHRAEGTSAVLLGRCLGEPRLLEDITGPEAEAARGLAALLGRAGALLAASYCTM